MYLPRGTRVRTATMSKLRFAGGLIPLCLRFAKDRKGNIAVTFALAMVPTIYLLGMTLDYTQAVRKRSQLNAAIDAAVIAAVTPAMMSQNATPVTTPATNVSNATEKNLTGLPAPPQLTITITNNGLVRFVTASYA